MDLFAKQHAEKHVEGKKCKKEARNYERIIYIAMMYYDVTIKRVRIPPCTR